MRRLDEKTRGLSYNHIITTPPPPPPKKKKKKKKKKIQLYEIEQGNSKTTNCLQEWAIQFSLLLTNERHILIWQIVDTENITYHILFDMFFFYRTHCYDYCFRVAAFMNNDVYTFIPIICLGMFCQKCRYLGY